MSSESPNPIRDRWALLVGVNRYIDHAFCSLKFCVNDVLALERMLKELGYTVVCLHDELDRDNPHFPTRTNIEAELTRLCQVSGSDDLLLAHFACHGTLVDGQPLLIAQDTRATILEKTALPLADVEQRMRQSKAHRLVLTLDACHVGVDIGRDLANRKFIHNAYELAEGFALIAGSTAQQVAQEWQDKEHGVFTYYLLEGLTEKADRDGKNFVTVDDLKTHVLDGLRRWNVEHGGIVQEPTARVEGLGDMILADYRKYPVSKDELTGKSEVKQSGKQLTGIAQAQPLQTPLTPTNIKKNVLEKRLANLVEEYAIVNAQIEQELGQVERLRLQRQADNLFQEMTKIEDELKQLN